MGAAKDFLSLVVFRSVLSVVWEFIHGIFIECVMGACALIWILELMKHEVKGTGIRERGPERSPEQESGGREE